MDSGFVRVLSALGDAGVAFVIAGVGGINFYARTPADAFATLVVDALVGPAVENLRRTLLVLKGLGYLFEAVGPRISSFYVPFSLVPLTTADRAAKHGASALRMNTRGFERAEAPRTLRKDRRGS